MEFFKNYFQEFNTMTLPVNTAYYESPPLFSSSVVPPIIFLFCQSQARHNGTSYKLSSQHFEIPGGRDANGEPRLEKIEILLSGARTDR